MSQFTDILEVLILDLQLLKSTLITQEIGLKGSLHTLKHVQGLILRRVLVCTKVQIKPNPQLLSQREGDAPLFLGGLIKSDKTKDTLYAV